jgi:hypothetical protein
MSRFKPGYLEESPHSIEGDVIAAARPGSEGTGLLTSHREVTANPS